MSADQYAHVEQDKKHPPSGNELPTYDDLANQNGPNSRFGRWRGWIEKRAAERYADTTPEERARRRARGWGNNDSQRSSGNPSAFSGQPPNENSLHIRTSSLSIQGLPPQSEESLSSISLPFVSEVIEPTRLKISHFGSRFLPHTTCQIHCILPLLGDRMLLVGHDEGLSVLDMFPQELTENGEIVVKGPSEAHCWPVWRGEMVSQMSLLEMEDNGSGTPQGVVLVIVGPSPDPHAPTRDTDISKTARLYNLAGLINLARWSISQRGAKPLDLHSVGSLQAPGSPSKKHRQQGSFARSLRSFAHSPLVQQAELTHSYQNLISSASSIGHSQLQSNSPSERSSPPASIRQSTDEFGWDMVEEVPLRWATDFVPLASPGSRLSSLPVLCFATWCDETRKGKGTGGQLLAVATKSNIVLYETPKGERAFRFVKELYTPLQPRNLSFVHQSSHDSHRSALEASLSGRFQGHKRTNSNSSALKGVINTASSSTPLHFGTHLSLFVVFDKRACLIRLGDSTVEEVDFPEDGSINLSGPGLTSTTSLRQRARLSSEIRESASRWIVPVRCELPIAGFPPEQGITEPVHIITKGKQTCVVPCPLPTKLSLYTPLHDVSWKSHPRHVSARVVIPEADFRADSAVLQLIAFNENGVEIHETGIGFMHKGKGRAVQEDVYAEEDLGETGFLSTGGNWDRMDQAFGPNAQGPQLLSAVSSTLSIDSTDSSDIIVHLSREAGVYCWYRKDLADWRIFWLGGRQ